MKKIYLLFLLSIQCQAECPPIQELLAQIFSKPLKNTSVKNELLEINFIGTSNEGTAKVPVIEFYRATFKGKLENGNIRIPVADARFIDDSVEVLKEMHKQVQFVYSQYRNKGIVSKSELKALAQVDNDLDPLRTIYISYSKENQDPLFVMRVYDGSILPIEPGMLLSQKPLKTLSQGKLPIEFEYPELSILDKNKIEVGRAAKDNTLKDVHLVSMIDEAVKDASHKYGLNFSIYAECLEARLEGYVKQLNFQVIAGTKKPLLNVTNDFQTIKKIGNEDRFILKISADDWIKMNTPKTSWPSIGT